MTVALGGVEETLVHTVVTAAGGAGRPSSLTVPSRGAVAGSVID
jgi:hypothetical protein